MATVSSSVGTPGGTVTFFEGASPLSTISLNSAGEAALTLASLAVGSQAITATYDGAGGLQGSGFEPNCRDGHPGGHVDRPRAAPGLKGRKTLGWGRADRGDLAGGARRGRANGPGDLRVRHEAREEDAA